MFKLIKKPTRNVSNIFKVNNKHTRTTSVASIVYFALILLLLYYYIVLLFFFLCHIGPTFPTGH